MTEVLFAHKKVFFSFSFFFLTRCTEAPRCPSRAVRAMALRTAAPPGSPPSAPRQAGGSRRAPRSPHAVLRLVKFSPLLALPNMWWNSTLFCLRGVTQTEEIVNCSPQLLLPASARGGSPAATAALRRCALCHPAPMATPGPAAGPRAGCARKSFLQLICSDRGRKRAARLIRASASGSNYSCTKRKSCG